MRAWQALLAVRVRDRAFNKGSPPAGLMNGAPLCFILKAVLVGACDGLVENSLPICPDDQQRAVHEYSLSRAQPPWMAENVGKGQFIGN